MHTMMPPTTLIGDSSDNIIGIKGIGPKTAAHWLNAYHDLEQLIDLASHNALKPLRLAQALLSNTEQLRLSHALVKLRYDIVVPSLNNWDAADHYAHNDAADPTDHIDVSDHRAN